MKKRMLGGIEVSAVGMGCMGFSTAYGKTPSEDESCRLMRLAHEQGCTRFDTAEIYATHRNEELVDKALEPIRAEVVLESKFSPRDPTRAGSHRGRQVEPRRRAHHREPRRLRGRALGRRVRRPYGRT